MNIDYLSIININLPQIFIINKKFLKLCEFAPRGQGIKVPGCQVPRVLGT